MNTVILLAAGKSLRAGQNKLWTQANPKGLPGNSWPLWTCAYQTFLEHPSIGRILVVVPKGEEFRFLPFIDSQKTQVVSGGETRMESFKRGLAAADFSASDVILDHNAANPAVTAREISAVIEAAGEFGAAAVSLPAVDTVITASAGNYEAILDRKNLRLMQTPQAVRGDILQNLPLAEATDLTSALLQKTTIKIIEASPANRKVTFAEDLESLRAQSAFVVQTFLGEDSHRFSNEGQLTLGGLTIAELPKLEANSDGDVILHAIGRALAQACGENFSEVADPLMLSGDLSSRDYLEPLLEKITIRHVSLSLECARPQIDPLAPALIASLSKILSLAPSQITLSAHTGEGLTPFGLGEGIRCIALLSVTPLT